MLRRRLQPQAVTLKKRAVAKRDFLNLTSCYHVGTASPRHHTMTSIYSNDHLRVVNRLLVTLRRCFWSSSPSNLLEMCSSGYSLEVTHCRLGSACRCVPALCTQGKTASPKRVGAVHEHVFAGPASPEPDCNSESYDCLLGDMCCPSPGQKCRSACSRLHH